MSLDLDSLKTRATDFLNSDSLRDLKTKASESLSNVGDAVRNMGGRVGEFAASDELKSVLPYLLSGGAAAVVGGMSAGRQKAEKGEERSDYLKRVLRNALLVGGTAAGGHYLLNKGVEKTVGGFSPAAALGGGQAVEGPGATMVKNIAFSPLTAAGAGASALYATHNRPGIGAGDLKEYRKRFANDASPYSPTPLSSGRLSTMSAREIGDLERSMRAAKLDEKTLQSLLRARQRAGLASDYVDPATHKQLAGLLNRIPGSTGLLNRIPGLKNLSSKDEQLAAIKGLMSEAARTRVGSTFGQSTLRRAGRGSLALTAAALPALLGAFITNKSE
jgi:hypothetical protein